MSESGPLTEIYCSECGHVVRAKPNYCPDCGAASPWDERAVFQFDPDDLPVVFEHQIYDDTSGLWRSFCREYFADSKLTGDHIAGLPEGFPDLECCIFDVWFRITPELEVEGPFLTEQEAQEA